MEPGLLRAQRRAARERLAPEVFAYAAQGSGESITRREARAAWDRVRLVPRMFADVTAVDTSAPVLGDTWASPVGIAPMSMQRAAHPEGEVAMARAVAAEGSTLVLSGNTGSTFAEVALTGARWWLQVYVPQDRTLLGDHVARAVDAGASALVLTVDTPVVARKADEGIWSVLEESWAGAEIPGAGAMSRDGGPDAFRRKAADLDWDDVDRLAGFGVPVVLKGVLHPDDAARAAEHGVRAVWVSTHGGRQLDQAVSTAAALPEVAHAVRAADRRSGRRTEVYVDGGVRTPAHLVAALALGADAVFLGRPAFWALAADTGPDAPGVRRLLAATRGGLAESLALAGAADPAALDVSHLADLR